VVVELTPPNPRFESMIARFLGLANSGRTRREEFAVAVSAGLLRGRVLRRDPYDPVHRLQCSVRHSPALGAAGSARICVYPELLAPHGIVEPEPAALAAAGQIDPCRLRRRGPRCGLARGANPDRARVGVR